MSDETRLTGEWNKLIAMPLFWPRFLFLSLAHIANHLTRIFAVNPAYWWLIAVCFAAEGVFVILEGIVLFRLRPSLSFRRAPVIVWIVFSLLALTSEIVNGGPVGFSLFPLFLLPALLWMGQEENFFPFYLASFAPVIAVSLFCGVFFFPLESNGFSLEIAALVPVLLCAMAWLLLNTERFYSVVFVLTTFLIMLLLYFSGVSGGRTGFVSILGTLLFFLIALTIKFRAASRHKHFRTSRLTFLIIVAVILLTALTVSGAVLLDSLGKAPQTPESIEHMNIWEKFAASLRNGNLLSNRGMIWKYTFKHIRLFGGGPLFYVYASELDAMQHLAHNSFLAVLGHCGPIAFVLFTAFCVYMLILSVRYGLAERRLYLFPFVMLVSFYLCSITEDVFYLYGPRSGTLLFYAACAFLLIHEGKREGRVLFASR